MIVKFDSLNRYEIPNFTICNPGCTYEDGKIRRAIGSLSHTSDEEVVLNFNALSTLSFRAVKVPSDGTPERDYVLRMYNNLQNRKYIYVDDIGFFVITDVSTGYEKGLDYKDITASSCEIEIQNKTLVYIEDNTYQFIELFEKIVASLPKWTIAYVDTEVAKRYRTFEDIDTSTNTLSFMMEDMQEAYECIFEFDITNRTISVFDKNNYVKKTDIFLSKDDLIDKLEIVENSDDLYTALSVFGEDNLTIAAVNPLGTSTIYNFDYYLDWMSETLRAKVIQWSKLIRGYLEPYYNMNLEYYDLFEQKSNCEYQLDMLETQLSMYSRCRDNIVAESSHDNVSGYNEALAVVGGTEIPILDSIVETLAEIDRLIAQTYSLIEEENTKLSNLVANIDVTNNRISEIRNEVSIKNYFTQAEYDELYDYIFEGDYTDEYTAITESMTQQERLAQMRELYDRAQRVMVRVSMPPQEFSIDTEDFIFHKKFSKWSEQLESGCLINVEIEDCNIAELFLTAIQLNWSDKQLSLSFGNRFNKVDPQSLFSDVLGDIKKTSNSLSYIKDIIYPIKSGKIESLEEDVANARALSMGNSIISQSGEVLIEGSGYTGRKRVSTSSYNIMQANKSSSVYYPEQLKIATNTIVFTTDAWETCTTILGNILLENLATVYGLNAQAIVGSLVLSDKLNIYDSSGTPILTVVDNKIEVRANDLENKINNEIEKLVLRIDGIDASIEDMADRISEIMDTLTLQKAEIEALNIKVEELDDEVTLMKDGLVIWHDFSEL